MIGWAYWLARRRCSRFSDHSVDALDATGLPRGAWRRWASAIAFGLASASGLDWLNTGFIPSWPRFSPLSPGRWSFDPRPTLMRFRTLQRKLAALCCSEAAGLRTIPLRRCRASRHPCIDGGTRFALAVFHSASRWGVQSRGIAIDPLAAPSKSAVRVLWDPHHLWLGLIATWSGVCRGPDSAHGLNALRSFNPMHDCGGFHHTAIPHVVFP